MAQVRTVYGVKHKNEHIRAQSRSGGFFTAISDYVLEKDGSVYGCALDSDFKAVHQRANTKEQRDRFRGYKYLQSKMSDTYKNVENDLKSGVLVLFSGTPCQVHGLLNYLNLKETDTSNLLTLDILCQGVPSPRVWNDFLEQKFNKSEIEQVDFRDKKNFGWREHIETVTVSGEEISSRVYTNLFYSHLILRQACFKCPYKSTHRISDITIGDFWHIEDNDKAFDDNKGISLVKVNTQKGNDAFAACEDELIVKEYPLAACIQPALSYNYAEPMRRKSFWNEYSGENIFQIAEKYTKQPEPGFTAKLAGLARKCVVTFLKKIIRIMRKW